MDVKKRVIGIHEVLDLAALLPHRSVNNGFGFRKGRL